MPKKLTHECPERGTCNCRLGYCQQFSAKDETGIADTAADVEAGNRWIEEISLQPITRE